MGEGSGTAVNERALTTLDETTVQRIAAGEVVERPSSVIKELVENSLDASADRIDVVIDGEDGTDRIEVTDDGHGIEPEALEMVIRPHTTSKITSHADLASGPDTFGFRGEALHAIAQVSRITIESRATGRDEGRAIVVEGGEIIETRAAGVPDGTRVTVTDLFGAVPARRKFLDSAETERRHCRRTVAELALANPAVAMSFEAGDRRAFSTPGNGDPKATIGAVYGRSVAESMLSVSVENPESEAVSRIEGFISEPQTTRATPEYMTTLVNGRPVDATELRRAILEAYDDRLAPDRYPFSIIDVRVPPDEVDVNVHPRKHEVQFHATKAVVDALTTAVAGVIGADNHVPTGPPRADAPAGHSGGPRPAIDLGAVSSGGVQATLPGTTGTSSDAEYERLPTLTVVGQVHDAYIIAESEESLVIIDQHAADERVNYEYLRERVTANPQHQRLAEPIDLSLTPEETAALENHRETISDMGFRLSVESPEQVRITGVPTVLGRALDPDTIETALHRLIAGAGEGPVETVLELADPMLADLACHPAITANEALHAGTMESLLAALDDCDEPWTCPHGRPTMIELDGDELAERFERDYPGARPCRQWDEV